jgi:PPOX class probable F420-dependent enzyme
VPAPPGPESLDEAAILELLGSTPHCVLSTLRADGRPHLTNMVFHWSPDERLLRFTTRAGRIKVRHLQRDPRCAVLVSSEDRWTFGVVDGTAELSAVTVEPGDETSRELRLLHGEDADLGLLVDEERLVIRVRIDHLYGAHLPVT